MTFHAVRRTLLLSAATLFGSASAAQAVEGPDSPPASSKPTIVLVHGAFTDASGWGRVVPQLQRSGYRVVAVANPLRNLASDAGSVASVVASIKGDVVLVGHSYGGAVISSAASTTPNVKSLVYIAAMQPDVGETFNTVPSEYPGSAFGEVARPVPTTLPDGTQGADLSIDPASYGPVVLGTSRAKGLAPAATQRPLFSGTVEDAAKTAAWKTLPSWYLVATKDRLVPPAAQRFLAKRSKAHTSSVASAHSVMHAHPAAVTKVIVRAARAKG
ncbi:alpha/beta fold hydrolase [Patulibacter americanus]|uniref:alpha/beta fold hydrolase n=1 Tax=Patulibacter americanus TaxID=588672 RepID=UPI0003B69E75|nr:alpha/beta hydrolase [Patulibacter americanus]